MNISETIQAWSIMLMLTVVRYKQLWYWAGEFSIRYFMVYSEAKNPSFF